MGNPAGPPFLKLIRTQNKILVEIILFAVGEDWQKINSGRNSWPGFSYKQPFGAPGKTVGDNRA